MTAASARSGPAARRWSTVADVRVALRRRWDRGELLSVLVGGEGWEPIRVPLRAPTSREMATDFGAVQDWATQLHRDAGPERRAAFRLETRTVGGRLVGANAVPVAVWVDEPEQAWRLLHVTSDVAAFTSAYAVSRVADPSIATWVAEHPLRVLAHADRWREVTATALWLRDKVGTAAYLREIDVPRVDTKFIESHRALLAELLDALAPGVADETRSAGKDFARRYGFSDKPPMTRVRSLDGAPIVGGFTDAVVRVDELARLEPAARRVLVVENEITYLALPPATDAVAFFGAGFDVLRLGRLPWLRDCDIVYWGDLDTHGFVILDRLRSLLPHVRSVLMDLETLTAHESQWTTDTSPSRAELERLTPGEAETYRTLRDHELGTSVRLEQERVAFDRVVAAVDGLWA
ncbi:hypothetical protein GCM10009721_11650 [Terrabacter tumescens]|uniref:DUF3322 and DUF2220 domain-containing protein n=1 Tax=Terrabacter tumescens TaxID=60443 RepID=A0ABQ2HQ18_9MICO|nr:Wadjet anti-phage system protein JetD domain-containing protein [Terrabacter tumescens]GGM88296.1 hypothetical protein GCM10009721_11650 [Terrabacter tumescens]